MKMFLLQTFPQLIIVSGDHIFQGDPRIRLIGTCVCVGFFAGPLVRLRELVLQKVGINTRSLQSEYAYLNKFKIFLGE